MAVGILPGHRQDNPQQPPKIDPLEAISKALQVATTVYGIKSEMAKTDLANEQLKTEQTKNQALDTETQQNQARLKALQDPNSVETQLTKKGTNALISGFQGTKIFQKNPVAFQDILSFVNDPKTTGFQVQQELDKNPVLKSITDLSKGSLQAEATANAAAARVGPQTVRNQSQANQQYSQEIKPFEDAITSSNRVLGIINRVQKGGPEALKTTPTLANDLSGALGQMFNNGKAATVYQQAHNSFDSLEGNASTKYGYVSGKPMNTITPDQLQQLKMDVLALRDEYGTAHQANFDSFKQGLDPSLVSALQKRFESFRKSSVQSIKDNSPKNDPTIENYAKTHNLSYEQAGAILKGRGYNGG